MFEKITFALIQDWVVERLKERSSWDGFVIIGICLAVLLAAPFIKIIAYAGIAYGVFTVIKKELKDKDTNKDKEIDVDIDL
jgi:hypothetical protein